MTLSPKNIIIVLSAAALLLWLGQSGAHGATYILILELAVLFGACLYVFKKTRANTDPKPSFVESLFAKPVIVWVLLGFSIPFLLYFVGPVFLNHQLHIQDYDAFVPGTKSIGLDMQRLTDLSRAWFEQGQSPYPIQFYPPLTYVFFAPLALLPYPADYFVQTLLTLLCFVVLTFSLPMRIKGREGLTLVVLFFITGLLSYGFQFELERGQNNVMTMFLCMAAIYIFHFRYDLRYLAYALFSLAVQFKLYPLIFIFMLVKDWRDWKGNLRRFAGLGLLNFALLFAMGPRIFWEFITNLPEQAANSKWYLITNHSISSFIHELTRGDWIQLPPRYKFLAHYDGYLRIFFFGLFALCFALALWRAYRDNESGLNTYLLLICTLGTLLIPVSVDYKLSILAAPMALFFIDAETLAGSRSKRLLAILLVFVSAVAYAMILFPYKIKPPILSSAFIPLIVILVCAAVLNLIRENARSPIQA